MVNYIPEVKLYPLEKTGKKFRKMADFADERGAVLIVDEGNPQYLLIRLAQPDCETEDIPEDEILEEVEDDGMDEVTNLKQQLETVNKRNADLRMQMIALQDILANVKGCLAQVPEFERTGEKSSRAFS